MQKKKIILILSLLIMTILISGCIDPNDTQNNNHNNNDNNNQNNDVYSFSDIALNTTDLNKVMDRLFYNHTKKPYSVDNLTGNDLKWNIQQGVFSAFACNTSRLHQSILEFDNEENASLSISLNEQNLLNQGYNKSDLSTIGDTSFLLQTSKPFNEDTIDVWSLSFAYDQITVTLVGYAEKRSDIINYAQQLEDNISEYIASYSQ